MFRHLGSNLSYAWTRQMADQGIHLCYWSFSVSHSKMFCHLWEAMLFSIECQCFRSCLQLLNQQVVHISYLYMVSSCRSECGFCQFPLVHWRLLSVLVCLCLTLHWMQLQQLYPSRGKYLCHQWCNIICNILHKLSWKVTRYFCFVS